MATYEQLRALAATQRARGLHANAAALEARVAALIEAHPSHVLITRGDLGALLELATEAGRVTGHEPMARMSDDAWHKGEDQRIRDLFDRVRTLLGPHRGDRIATVPCAPVHALTVTEPPCDGSPYLMLPRRDQAGEEYAPLAVFPSLPIVIPYV